MARPLSRFTPAIQENRAAEAASTKSRKQGPSHRKVRRWNNDNFVNLAAELQKNGPKNHTAAQALLKGAEEAYSHKSLLENDASERESKAMNHMLKNDRLRDQFFQEGLQAKLVTKPSSNSARLPDTSSSAPKDLLNRIEGRLRRVIIKACQNSMPATQVVDRLETFLVDCFQQQDNNTDSDNLIDAGCLNEDWSDLLLESPEVTRHSSDDYNISVTFLFDSNSSTGGFHRLLLHGLCQFHGLAACSSTRQVTVGDSAKSARVLTAQGNLLSPNIKLVNCVMEEHLKSLDGNSTTTPVDGLRASLETLKV